MSNELLWFENDVSLTGYEWVEAYCLSDRNPKAKKELVLAPCGDHTAGSKKHYRTLSPLSANPSLFRVLAEIGPDDTDRIRDFANNYGCLNRYPFGWVLERSAKARSFMADAIWEWRRLIVLLKRTVDLWELIEANDGPGLSNQFSRFLGPNEFLNWLYDMDPSKQTWEVWSDDAGVGSPSRPYGGEVPFPVKGPLSAVGEQAWLAERAEAARNRTVPPLNPSRPLTDLGPIENARLWLGAMLTDSIMACPPVAMTTGQPPRLVLHFKPQHLGQAVWIQFAQAVAGNKQFRSCKGCAKWFEVSVAEDARSARKLFCSDSCKVREYRFRQKKATELHAGGATVKAIAAEVQTDVKTVRGWVGKQT